MSDAVIIAIVSGITTIAGSFLAAYVAVKGLKNKVESVAVSVEKVEKATNGIHLEQQRLSQALGHAEGKAEGRAEVKAEQRGAVGEMPAGPIAIELTGPVSVKLEDSVKMPQRDAPK